MLAKNAKVLISILNWNNSYSTLITYNSVLKLNYSCYEVIIIDNCSTDNSLEVLSENTNCRILNNDKNYGYAGGHKKILDIFFPEKFDLLWILNNDVEVQKDSLSALVKSYLNNGLGLYGSLIIDENSKILFSGGNEIRNGFIDYYRSNLFRGQDFKEVKNSLQEKKVGILNGSSFLIPGEIIKTYGFINCNFFLYGEEVDYCLKLLKKKVFSFFVPDSVVIHKLSSTTNMNKGLAVMSLYYQARNALYNNLNHNFPRSSRLFIMKGNKTIFFSIILCYANFKLFKKRRFSEMKLFYTKLAVIHFLFGVKGRTLKPEKFIKIIL